MRYSLKLSFLAAIVFCGVSVGQTTPEPKKPQPPKKTLTDLRKEHPRPKAERRDSKGNVIPDGQVALPPDREPKKDAKPKD